MAKARIVVEVLVLIALAFGIWKVVTGGSDTPKQKAGSPNTEEVASSENAPKLLRSSGKKASSTKASKQPLVDENAAPLAATSVASGSTERAGANNPVPVPSAPGPTPDELGGLQVTLMNAADPSGALLGLNGWLVSDDCNWKIRIFDGVVDKQIEAMSCSIYAVVELGEKEDPIITRAQRMETIPGKTLSLRFAVTLPESSSSPDAERAQAARIAHPGLGLLKQNEFAEVVQVVPGSSAASQGLQAGDIVMSIDGVAVQELTQDNIVALLQGEPDTPLKIAIVVEENGELVQGAVDLLRSTIAE